MKLFLSVMLILLVIGCDNEKKHKVVQTLEQKAVNVAKSELSYHIEKLVLISKAIKIPYDTLYNVMQEYLVKTSTSPDSDDSTRLQIQNSIELISSKYHVSEKKIAAIIFNYKYEMLTKEEIEQAAIDDYEPEPEPDDDPDY